MWDYAMGAGATLAFVAIYHSAIARLVAMLGAAIARAMALH